LDLAKATVNHKTLLQILPSFGINDRSLNWFHSYLTNRKQRVKINNVTSQDRYIEYGVPQSSVLGPILFILYINSVCDLNLDGRVVSYADDTYLLFTDKTWEGVHSNATIGINEVHKCLSEKNLILNDEKTMFMTFSINKTLTNKNAITK